MSYVNRLVGPVLAIIALACVSIAMANPPGCYINDEAMCEWFWFDDDQCADRVVPPSVESPILAAYGAPEGVDDTVEDFCELTVQHNFWLGPPLQ